MGTEPLLKWPGGKRWLTQRYPQFFAPAFSRFVEPFVGGGAVFFSLTPRTALLADLNRDLIRVYETVKADWLSIARCLNKHQRKHLEDPLYYYEVRSSKPKSEWGYAAKFIYLNKTCFNGLYRVNLKGQFNVPKGSKTEVAIANTQFAELAKILGAAKLVSADFEETLNRCGAGDFVFVDPPYTMAHNNNGFLKYNERIFSWSDQVRLAGAVKSCAARGARLLVTNAAHQAIRELYQAFGQCHVIERASRLASDPTKRVKVEEMVVFVGYSIELPDRTAV